MQGLFILKWPPRKDCAFVIKHLQQWKEYSKGTMDSNIARATSLPFFLLHAFSNVEYQLSDQPPFWLNSPFTHLFVWDKAIWQSLDALQRYIALLLISANDKVWLDA